ncbi:MAG TPA: hypothetical protein VGJ44_00605 [Kribbellaceae bacterium]
MTVLTSPAVRRTVAATAALLLGASALRFCADQIIHQPMGGITQDKIEWVNRPTYQQEIEFPARRGDNVAGGPRRTGTRCTSSSSTSTERAGG